MVAQVLRTSLGDDSFFAFIEHDDTIRHRVDTRQLVGDNDKRHAKTLPKPEYESVEFRRRHRIETRGRLIEKKHGRVERHRPRDGRALLHTAADFGGQMAAKALQSHQLELHPRNYIPRLPRAAA